jgi:hypothetical protein
VAQATAPGPQYTWDHIVASSLPHKPVAHALTQKTYLVNQNKMCPKHAHKDTPDSSVSSTPGPYHADCVSRPLFHCRIAQTNSTLLIVSRIQPSDSFKYFSRIFFFFQRPFSCQASLLSFEPHQEISRGHQSPPNHNA